MQLFLDCDGVLADFETYAETIFGLPPRSFEEKFGTKRFWVDLQSHEGFFEKLPLMPDAKELFESVEHLNPVILTALPVGIWAEPQKRAWGAKHFPNTKMICCMARDKKIYMQPGDILIDDWPKYKHIWEEAGGIFILHTSAKDSIAKLKELGVLS